MTVNSEIEDERLGPIVRTAMSEAQQAAAAELCATPRGTVFGPFMVMLRSPEVLTHAQRLGEYLRFRSLLPIELRELAILITGRHWEQPYVWYVHEPVARKHGISNDVICDIAAGHRPELPVLEQDEVYDFCHELTTTKSVSNISYTRVLRRFGEQGVIELTAIVAYFGLLAMMMNVARTPLPEDGDFVTPFVIAQRDKVYA
jgi:4-carboxymuconolactone decarboxylase